MTSKSFVPSLSTVLPSPPGTAAIGTSADAAKADHVHPSQSVPSPSSATPLVESGSGSAGSASTYARGDHVHPAAGSSFASGSPNSRTLSASTAYQATDPTKAALINLNINSTASISLSGGTTNAVDVVIGSTNAVASGTGTVIGKYANSNTGTLTIGLNLNTIAGTPCSFVLPANWYFAYRVISGSATLTSAFDQSLS